MKRKTTWNLLCFQTSPSCAIEIFSPLFVCWRVRGYFFGGNLKGIFEALIWSFHTNTSKVVSSFYDKVPFLRRFACQMLMLLLAEQSFSCSVYLLLFSLSFSAFRSSGCLALLWLVVTCSWSVNIIQMDASHCLKTESWKGLGNGKLIIQTLLNGTFIEIFRKKAAYFREREKHC